MLIGSSRSGAIPWNQSPGNEGIPSRELAPGAKTASVRPVIQQRSSAAAGRANTAKKGERPLVERNARRTYPGAVPGYAQNMASSADGTPIGYRQYGSGPGLILVHGGMQAAQHLSALAADLAGQFQ